jgi:hypothetical protein
VSAATTPSAERSHVFDAPGPDANEELATAGINGHVFF